MTKDLSNASNENADLQPTNLDLMENPLEFIKEDHMHIRAMCELINQIAGDESPDGVQVSKVISFLEHEIGMLIHDEDDDLRRLLLKRCSPGDDIIATLDQLKQEHEMLGAMMPGLIEQLNHIHDEKRSATLDERTALREFSDRLLRHLVVENAIVLPFARARLTEQDVVQLRTGMIRRRIEDMQD